MKLNFWQWLGVILLIIGIAVYFWDRGRSKTTSPVTPADVR
jgi:drug/metabolite transporter (DMT)-like permease